MQAYRLARSTLLAILLSDPLALRAKSTARAGLKHRSRQTSRRFVCRMFARTRTLSCPLSETNSPGTVAFSARIRPRLSLKVRSPLRPARASAKPFSTPRNTAIRACSQRSRSKSHAGTSSKLAPSRAYSRLSCGKSMSLQICKPARLLCRFEALVRSDFPAAPVRRLTRDDACRSSPARPR